MILLGARHCFFAVMDQAAKELREFGYYISQDEEVDYKMFFEETAAFNFRYYQTAVAYDANECIQVPSVVYRYEDGQLHLDTLYGKKIHTTVASENVQGWNLYNVYRLPAALQSAAIWKFLSAKYWNLNTVLLRACPPSKGEEKLYVDFKTDEFSVLMTRNDKLLLAKTFVYSSPDDVLYYLLKGCQQYNLSQQVVNVSLSGLIEKDSAIYRELYKYFIHLGFERLTGDVKLGQELKAHPEHYYSSIGKLAACVS